jgi:hypothetical protein
MKLFPCKKPVSQKGSVLFIILIGVMLFAALSYSVAHMMRGGSPTMIGEEKSRLFGDEILNYARALRSAVQNLKISNSCKDSEISFEHTDLAGYTHSPVVPDTCKIFHSSGGGMVYQAPSAEWLDTVYSPAPALRGNWYFPANTCVPGTGTAPAGGCDANGDDDEAIIAVLPFLRRQICIQINDLLGVANPGGEPPAETANAWPAGNTKFAGAFSDGEQIDQPGVSAGCFRGSGIATPPANTYHFFQVILPR